MKIRVRSVGVACPSRVVAALAEKRNLSDQELAVVAPVNFVAVQAVLRYRRVLKCKGTSFFGVTRVTKIVDRVSLHHSWPKSPMDIMAVAASDPAFIHRVMRLLILLGPDVFVAGITEIGFSNPQGFTQWSMNGMAVVAGDLGGFMSPDIPRGQMV